MHAVLDSEINLHQTRIGRLFVPKFYYDQASTNFLKHPTYLGEIKPETSNGEFKYPEIGRIYYSHKKTDFLSHILSAKDVDWPFPDTYFNSIGLLVRGFQFLLLSLSHSLKSLFQPSENLQEYKK